MKFLITVAIFVVVVSSNSLSQISTTYVNIDSVQQPLIFYGFDFSHLKFVSRRFTGKEMNGFVQNLNKFLVKKVTNKHVLAFSSADSVRLDYYPTELINKTVIDSTVLTLNKPVFPYDSIPHFISNYALPDSNGTGCIIFFDCFERKTNITSAYLVLFENKSRKILTIEHINNFDSNSYSKLSDWNIAAFLATNKLLKRLAWNENSRNNELDLIAKYDAANKTDSTFKSNIFKTKHNELPVTFGVTPVLGFSSSVMSGGIIMDADIFHILIGYRYIFNPVPFIPGEEAYDETAYFFGYRFRKNKYAVSFGSGFGKMDIHCTSGLNSDCENFKDEIVNTVPLFLEYAYFMNPYVGFAISFNASFTDRRNTAALLCGFKFGLSRNIYDGLKYNK